MQTQKEIRKQAAQRLRELFPQAMRWEDALDARVGAQQADLLVKFWMGEQEKVLVCDVKSLGQPRHIREAITRLSGLREQIPNSYPLAVSTYISPQSAALLRRRGMGYLDLSGNCYIAFDNVLIEKSGKPNVRPSTRPLRTLFAPRATRVIRVLLVDPGRVWNLEELARAASVSLGHAHNVVKRLLDLEWVERGDGHRIRLRTPGDLLNAWRDEYTYRRNPIVAYHAPERELKGLMVPLARAAEAAAGRYAFTLHAGASLIAPRIRFSTLSLYYTGDREALAQAVALRPAERGGNVQVLTPFDEGIYYGLLQKGGCSVVSLPQLYVDLAHYEARGLEQAEYLRRQAMGY